MRTLIKPAFALIFAAMLFTACSEDPASPDLENISGIWDGSLNHPGYDSGTISLNILENSNNLSGTFTMRLVKNNSVQNYSGTIAGAKTNDKAYSLSLIGSNFVWVCALDQNSFTLSGNWESTTHGGLSGTLSVQKN
jgi:hypothetical protein